VIEAFELADLESGRKARMTFMTFSGCLEWNTGAAQAPGLMQTAKPGAAYVELIEAKEDCGLDPAVYRLSDRMAGGREGMQNPYLTPDMDGDGRADFVAAVDRIGNGAPGLAMCLADGALILARYDGRIGQHLDPEYFGRVDWWRVHSGEVFPSGAEGPPPTLRGDALLMGKNDSSSALLYLDLDAGLRPASHWQGD
jgi:hypothetical protein